MKKTILFFIFLSGIIFGQEKAVTASGKNVILNSDNTWKFDEQHNSGLNPEYFKSNNKNMVVGIFDKIQIPIKNGEEKNVDVYFEFLSTTDQFSNISVNKIQKMIDYSRDYLLSGLKNKYSFVPRKVKVSYSDSKKAWLIIWDYTAKNSYGGDVAGDKLLLYNNDLERVEI
ncbi:hypothetical protein NAL32_07300 [Chryseobacterium sp. Ch-15]|uniref:Uncharacterized protein n=1 Tax=Chryseobacterium muglaense TaxID=2893752 RepID=A0A9Q3USS6_9FLAO|nr:hypothetical protein [Chryseobacterium muglaense]MBD3904437.1 hypothetical protein [Chryseobacterium muglaense]MCC9032744.1 hypothetical protein [Chryseobacterium muglaense]MCM2554199.1 hypothetical protein [Chryseobacterium muglaense]